MPTICELLYSVINLLINSEPQEGSNIWVGCEFFEIICYFL